MKAFRAAAGLACLLMPLASAAGQAPGLASQTAPNVAVQQVAIGAPNEQMVLAIWHPAVTPDGAPKGEPGTIASVDGNVPLVIISHGTGAGPLAHVDTAEALAAAGFVVVAPMHRGDNFQDDSNVGRREWMVNRSRDISNAIDFMLQEWMGRARLDGSRVGIFGFSAGATTALISAGGVPDLGRLAPHCAAQREFVCDIIPAQAELPDAGAPLWTHDSRIVAAVIAAPGLGFLFEPDGLANVRVPVQLWVGSEDETVPYATNGGVVRQLLRERTDFHSVDDAGHLSFLAPCTPETPPQLCQEREGFDRSAFHRTFNQSVTEFFREHLSFPLARTEARKR